MAFFGLIGGRKKQWPYEGWGSNANTVAELDYGVKSLSDAIGARVVGSSMAARTGYRMAARRGADAVGRAAITTKESGEWTRQFAQHEANATASGPKIVAMIKQVSTDVATLTSKAQTEIAVDLGLIASPSEEAPVESDVTKQLLADAEDPKAKAKQAREAEKQEQSATRQETSNFYSEQEKRSQQLETEINVTGLSSQTETLEKTVVPMLASKAKPEAPEEEKKVLGTSEGLKDYQSEQVQRQMARQLQEATSAAAPSEGIGGL